MEIAEEDILPGISVRDRDEPLRTVSDRAVALHGDVGFAELLRTARTGQAAEELMALLRREVC